MKAKSLLTVFILCVGLLSCSEDETVNDDVTNGEAYLNLTFNPVTEPTEENRSQKAQESSFSFSDGTVTIDQLHFEVMNESDSVQVSVHQELQELITVDLASGLSDPEISGLIIPAGIYEKVQVAMTLQGTPDDDTGTHTHVIEGAFTDPTGEEHPVRFEFSSDETFTLEREGDFIFAESDLIEAEVSLNPDAWLSDVSSDVLSSLETNSEGVIVISETQNSNVLDIALDRLELASQVEVTRHSQE